MNEHDLELLDADDQERALAAQPFPVVEIDGDELVRAPREYSTLVEHPEPIPV